MIRPTDNLLNVLNFINAFTEDCSICAQFTRSVCFIRIIVTALLEYCLD